MIQYNLMKMDITQRIIGPTIFLFTFLYGRGPIWILVPVAALIVLFEWRSDFSLKGTTSPYIFLMFSPALLLNFVSINDFLIRTTCFILLVFILCFVRSPYRRSFKIQLNRFKPSTIYLISAGIFCLTSCFFYVQNIHLSGDEPHYILIAQSMVEDGDVNLANNMRDRTYASFHPVEIKSHGIIRRGRILPFHMPGLSILLIPFYILYKWIFPFVPSHLFFRLAASMINGFFAMGLFFTIKKLFPKKNISGFWIYFICTFPLLFHAIHLYPELPAAALIMGAFFYGYMKEQRFLLAGLFLSLVPWFHLKYAPVLLVLTVAIILRMIRKKQNREMAVFFIFPLISFILLELYCKGLYGTFNPAGIFPSARYWSIPYSLKLKTLFAYFLDQRDGILLFAPIFFLALMCSRRKREPRRILMVMGGAYLAFHAFTTLRGAYSPAGRPVIFIIWIFIYFVLNHHESLKNKSRVLLKSLAGFGFFTTFWILYHPLFIYQPVYAHTTVGDSSLLTFLSGSFFHLPDIFPSFLSTTPLYDPANCLWIGILAMTSFFICNQVIRPVSPLIKKIFTVSIFVVLIGVFSIFPRIRLDQADRISTGEYIFFNASDNFRQLENRDTFRLKYRQTYHIYFPRFQLSKGIMELTFIFSDRADVSIRNSRYLLSRLKQSAGGIRRVRLSDLVPFKLNGREYVHLAVKIRGKTDNQFLQLKISRSD